MRCYSNYAAAIVVRRIVAYFTVLNCNDGVKRVYTSCVTESQHGRISDDFPSVNGKDATEPGPSRYCGNTATAVVRTDACYFPTVHLDVTARGKDAITTTGLAVFYERGVHDQTASTDIP